MQDEKPIRWLSGEEGLKTPPFEEAARREAGWALGCLQLGENLEMPISRPMPDIGPRCHELRVRDATINWRIIYRIDDDAILVVHYFKKKTRQTPKEVIELCQKRLREYDEE